MVGGGWEMRTYDLIKKLLSDFPETRNSDKILIWKVWEVTGHAYGDHISKGGFFNAISTESIRRARQKVQELHRELRPTSSEVVRKRRMKEETKGTFVYREDNGQGKFI